MISCIMAHTVPCWTALAESLDDTDFILHSTVQCWPVLPQFVYIKSTETHVSHNFPVMHSIPNELIFQYLSPAPSYIFGLDLFHLLAPHRSSSNHSYSETTLLSTLTTHRETISYVELISCRTCWILWIC